MERSCAVSDRMAVNLCLSHELLSYDVFSVSNNMHACIFITVVYYHFTPEFTPPSNLCKDRVSFFASEFFLFLMVVNPSKSEYFK